MKFSILKIAAVGLISLAAVSSANAFWQCRIHNGRGQTWIGTAHSQGKAAANATGICMSNSRYGRNCVIDWCQPVHTGRIAVAAGPVTVSIPSGPVAVPGSAVVAVPGAPVPMRQRNWRCEVTNARGQLWIGNGYTHDRAAARAVQVCSANSVYARNCIVRACYVR